MKNLIIILCTFLITVIISRWDDFIIVPIPEIINWVLGGVIIADYLLGVTSKIWSNSVIELILRGLGRLYFYTFNLGEKGKYLDKKTKRN